MASMHKKDGESLGDDRMTHWNNRVIEFADPLTGASWFQVHEVFYDEDTPVAYGENPAPVCGDSLDEMRETLARMQRAIEQPALREVDFKIGSTDRLIRY